MISRRRLMILSAAALLATPAAAEDTPKVPVVASFTILADFVKEVGGDRVSVTTLVGPDGDVHVFQPSPADAKSVAAAKVVVLNGLGLEGWADRLVKASGSRAEVVAATKGITPRTRTATEPQDDDEEEGAAAGHDHEQADGGHPHHGATDPHAWQSVANAEVYVRNIRDGLIAADPAGEAAYAANAAAYLARLEALDAEVKAALARIPAEQRRIITSHDAFGYFGDAYGLTLIAPAGVSTESEASARDVAMIIRQVKQEKVPAVFLENVTDPRLMEQIARESGAKVGGELYSDALTDDKGPAATYIDMMRSNVRTLSSALAS